MSEEALTIAETRREVKGKREKKNHPSVEFQRITRRDKNAFSREQSKEIEDSNRMGKIRDLQENQRHQGNVSYKDGHNKGKKLYGPHRTEDNEKRWQKHTENCTKKCLNDLGYHDSVFTHLEPDILECEVTWTVGNITMNKARGGDGIPAELFQILNDDAVKAMHSISQKIWKIQQRSQDWKKSVFIPIPENSNAKECSNYSTIVLISHVSKLMLKILQARLQQYVN